MPRRILTSRGVTGLIISGRFMPRRILTSRGVTGCIYCLQCSKTIQFPSSQPSIRTLLHCIQALGYLVNVYPVLTNVIQSIPPDIQSYVVKLADTLLVIIPPGNGSSGNSSQADPAY